MRNIEILLIEDSQDFINLILEYTVMINKGPSNLLLKLTTTDSFYEAEKKLYSNNFDMIISDLKLTDTYGHETIQKLERYVERLPIIILTGIDDEQMGINAIKTGVQDYIIKQHLTYYLLRKSINYSLERFGILREKEKLINELEVALKKGKTLTGFLPICASCKKIRNDKEYWEQVEDYIKENSDLEFSHGICPDCAQKLYGNL